jgi:hypothetical protein
VSDGEDATTLLQEMLDRMAGAPDWRVEVVRIQSSIGRYVAMFSLIPRRMRDEIVTMVTGPRATDTLPVTLMQTLLAKMTADPLRSAFFAMASQMVDFDAENRAIVAALQAEVQFQIKLRNDVAHADWSVGMRSRKGEVITGEARRMRVSKADGAQHSLLTLDADALFAESQRAYELSEFCGVFGLNCRVQSAGHTSPRLSQLLEVFEDEEASRRRVRFTTAGEAMWGELMATGRP